jgi:hypothetical protein
MALGEKRWRTWFHFPRGHFLHGFVLYYNPNTETCAASTEENEKKDKKSEEKQPIVFHV